MNIYADVFSMALTILVGLAGGVYGMVMHEYNLTLATGASPTSARARDLEDKRKFMSRVLLALLVIDAIVQFAF